MSPTQRSLKYLRDAGMHAEVVEHWNSFSRTRKDLWGWCDILCLGGDRLLAVQTTSKSNVSARVKKIKASPTYPLAVEQNIKIVVHGWHKVGGRWQVVIKELA